MSGKHSYHRLQKGKSRTRAFIWRERGKSRKWKSIQYANTKRAHTHTLYSVLGWTLVRSSHYLNLMKKYISHFFLYWEFIMYMYRFRSNWMPRKMFRRKKKPFGRKHSNQIFNKYKNQKQNDIAWFTTKWPDHCVVICSFDSKKLSQAYETRTNGSLHPHFEWFRWNIKNLRENHEDTECRMQNKQKLKDIIMNIIICNKQCFQMMISMTHWPFFFFKRNLVGLGYVTFNKTTNEERMQKTKELKRKFIF